MDYEKFNKLPKWAQNEFRILQSQIEEYKLMLFKEKLETDDSIYMKGFRTDEEYPLRIPTDEPIYKKFRKNKVELRIDLHKTDEISIMGYYTKGDLVISPMASNHIKIQVK